jgi:hypothetical protein
MVYDNTKFYAAFDAWMDQNVEVGYGDHYVGDLLADFCEFCEETKMMKRSPGRVVFGQRLNESGFDRRKKLGLTHWYGLKLLKARITAPKRYQKVIDAETAEAEAREKRKRHVASKTSPEARKLQLDKFRAELLEEEERQKGLEE